MPLSIIALSTTLFYFAFYFSREVTSDILLCSISHACMSRKDAISCVAIRNTMVDLFRFNAYQYNESLYTFVSSSAKRYLTAERSVTY